MEYRIALTNGKFAYGPTSWDALVKCVGERKADIIASQIKRITERGEIIALNGVTIGYQEKRIMPV